MLTIPYSRDGSDNDSTIFVWGAENEQIVCGSIAGRALVTMVRFSLNNK